MSTARSVLVVTAAGGFGELIQHALEGTGIYKVMLVDSDQEALLCIQTVAFNIAILDCELPGEQMIDLATRMRQMLPKMRLVMVCSEDLPLYPAAIAFRPAGLISKPLSMPELLETMQKAMTLPSDASRNLTARTVVDVPAVSLPTVPPAPDWLLDADWAARQLTRLSLESSAEAALIVRDGLLWAYAGELEQTATGELVDELNTYWEVAHPTITRSVPARNQARDLVRFIHLEATQGEYMLYATSLGQGMVLCLAFESDTPFSTIRAQASYLARALATPPGSPLPPYPKLSAAVNQMFIRKEADSYAMAVNMPPLIEDVPPPKPNHAEKMAAGKDNPPSWYEEASAPVSLTEAPLAISSPIGVQSAVKRPPAKSEPAQADIDRKAAIPKVNLENLSNIEQKAAIKPIGSEANPAHNPLTNGNPSMAPDLLPGTPTLHYLTYSCTLIPRLPQHQLGGDLAQLVQEWMPQLFLAFGWQLLHMGIFPEYLQVIGRVTPNTSPGSFVRIIRQQTSRRIFTAFPRIREENPSLDYWAPGYLILSNSQPPPNHVIRHFIEQTRLQQGASKRG